MIIKYIHPKEYTNLINYLKDNYTFEKVMGFLEKRKLVEKKSIPIWIKERREEISKGDNNLFLKNGIHLNRPLKNTQEIIDANIMMMNIYDETIEYIPNLKILHPEVDMYLVPLDIGLKVSIEGTIKATEMIKRLRL